MSAVEKNKIHKAGKVLASKLIVLLTGILVISAFLLWNCLHANSKQIVEDQPLDLIYTRNYDVSQLKNSKENEIIKYGYEIFQNSSKLIGPKSKNDEHRYAGNNLSCTNCHLGSGTKPFAAPLIGIIQRFPQYRGRENKMGTIKERINGCMERSMNGDTIPKNGKEMNALIAYLNWLSRFASKDGKIKGQGFVKINVPNRAVDLEKGKAVFTVNCAICHQKNGQGKWHEDNSSYEYPPLWGKDSYNNGAGMTRVITAAQFIKANMPFGTTYKNPVLSDEEAYDVAGYINHQLRPEKANKERDFPDLKKKPVSTPYPPFIDTFSIKQHQLGPFLPIMEYYKNEHNIVKSK
ncbi:c-type cytochrome [Aurantibacter sp.]|uniref:c-type cytochrome n=1 Tax=Aurantibacter sp. TaxID=2807103 RepID=UPI003264F6D6